MGVDEVKGQYLWPLDRPRLSNLALGGRSLGGLSMPWVNFLVDSGRKRALKDSGFEFTQTYSEVHQKGWK